MGNVVALVRPEDRKNATARVGMIVFLSAWAMMFGALFFSVVFVRAQAEAWPPEGTPALPTRLALAATLVLVVSSALWELGRRSLGQVRTSAALLLCSSVLGVGFLVAQGVLLWMVRRLGLTGSFAGLLGALVFFHAVHVASGLPGLFVVALRASRGRYHPLRQLGVRLWGMYWHFVGVVWLGIFFLFFTR